MKKFVVLSLVGFFILAFGTAYAAEEKAPVLEFKASGFIDVIFEYNMNVPQPGAATSARGATSTNDVMFGPPPAYFRPNFLGFGDEAYNNTQAYVENRGRLKFDAMMGKEMTGTFYFEFDSTRWGERAPSGAQRNYSGHWGVADRSSLELKNMFITFAMPWIPIPITIQAGIHPLVIRPAVFLAVDGPGVTVAAKFDPVTVKFAWFKALENRDWASDDADIYALEANAKIATFTIGGYAVDFNMNSYPIADAATPSFRSDMWWFGGYLDGKLGPLNINADLVLDHGNVEARNWLGPFGEVDYRGWSGLLKVSFPWEKFNFGVATIYGSGADQSKTSASGDPLTPVAYGPGLTDKVGAFIVPAGTEGGVGHSLILCGAGINRMNTGFEPAATNHHARAPVGGLWINKIFGSVQIIPEWKLTAEVMYIRDTTKEGNTIGNAVGITGLPEDEKSIGWEIDVFSEHQLYKNLKLSFGGGILLAGDAMDYAVIGAPVGFNESPDNPWALVTNLTYSF